MNRPKLPAPPLEEWECQQFVIWLDMKKILFFHVPNEGKRGLKAQALFKSMGGKKGVLDYFIFDRPTQTISDGVVKTEIIFNGVVIEMKRQEIEGYKWEGPTPEQEWWLMELEGRGWKTIVAKGFADAIEQLERLGF